jgi:acetolactate synthase I/II/III large subunit
MPRSADCSAAISAVASLRPISATPRPGAPYNPDFAAMARSAGIAGVNVDRAADLADALRAALASRRPYLINANIGADKNPGGAGVWELPGLGQSQPAFGGRYQP